MNLLTLCLVIIFISDISYGTRALRIRRLVGGQTAIKSEFPYLVSLRYYNKHSCSGVLISDRHVLSAAYCACKLIEPSKGLSVFTGSISLEKGEKHAVKDVKCHPDNIYNSRKIADWRADIVVITLAKKIYVSPSQSPIALATYDPPVGQRAIITGWGSVHPSNYSLSRNLQKLSMSIIDNDVCQSYYYKRNITILTSQICTLERKGIGCCKGDSGSPLVYNGTLVGILSWSIVPCAVGFPGLFTRVTHFTDFIKQMMQDEYQVINSID